MADTEREALDELLVSSRAGRVTRRSFIARTMVLGFSASAAMSLLEACGGDNGSGTANITWTSENDPSGSYQALVQKYNDGPGKTDNVHVTYTNGPQDTGQFRQKTITDLRARSGQDILSMDIIWPAEFFSNGWTKAVDKYWSSSERDKYLPGPLQGCTFQGKVVAAPLRTDAGLLYYRNDIGLQAPDTYDAMTSQAEAAAGGGKAKYGYVWQGAQYEGLVCDFAEVLGGYGGSVLDPQDDKKVTVNSPQALEALNRMISWVGKASPSAVTTWKEEDSRTTFQNGDAAFMRNWPYAYSLGNNASQSKVASKFSVKALPHGGSGSVGRSCLGGWQLGINNFSKNPDAAWKFVAYMLGPDAQKYAAINASVFSTLKSVYTDSDVTKAQPFFAQVGPIFQNTVPRPVTPKYPNVTDAIQKHIHDALTKQSSPADALKNLESDLKSIVA